MNAVDLLPIDLIPWLTRAVGLEHFRDYRIAMGLSNVNGTRGVFIPTVNLYV